MTRSPVDDFKTVLAVFPLSGLLLLEQKFEEGKVCHRAFKEGSASVSGCLMHWLSEEAIMDGMSFLSFRVRQPFSVCVAFPLTINAWDFGRLTESAARDCLRAAIADREAAQEEETRTVEGVETRELVEV